jgi:hypothetical protein
MKPRIAIVLLVMLLAACVQDPGRPQGPHAELAISLTGAYTLDGKPVAAENLSAELLALRKRDPRIVLFIYYDENTKMFEGLDFANKAAAAAGLSGIADAYPEQVKRRRMKSLLADVLFWVKINLVAMLVVAPFALARKRQPAQAFRIGLFGVWLVGVLIAAAMGVYKDIEHHGGGVTTIGMTVMAWLACLPGGLVAGSVFWIWSRIRSANAPVPTAPPRNG